MKAARCGTPILIQFWFPGRVSEREGLVIPAFAGVTNSRQDARPTEKVVNPPFKALPLGP